MLCRSEQGWATTASFTVSGVGRAPSDASAADGTENTAPGGAPPGEFRVDCAGIHGNTAGQYVVRALRSACAEPNAFGMANKSMAKQQSVGTFTGVGESLKVVGPDKLCAYLQISSEL